MKTLTTLLALTFVSTGAHATSSASQNATIATMAVAGQIVDQNLLPGANTLLQAALERDNGYVILPLSRCELSGPSFTCNLDVKSPGKITHLEVILHNGTVVQASYKID